MYIFRGESDKPIDYVNQSSLSSSMMYKLVGVLIT